MNFDRNSANSGLETREPIPDFIWLSEEFGGLSSGSNYSEFQSQSVI